MNFGSGELMFDLNYVIIIIGISIKWTLKVSHRSENRKTFTFYDKPSFSGKWKFTMEEMQICIHRIAVAND